MKKYPAIAIVEFKDISMGMYATDSMLKKAPISLLRCGIIGQGRYLTLIGGTTASVDESFHEALYHGQDNVMDCVMLPDVHPQVHDAVLGRRAPFGSGSMAIVETETVSCNVRTAELALKGTPVDLVEIRMADSWMTGKGVSIYRGELHDIEAAVEIGVAFLDQIGRSAAYKIIPAPHEAMVQRLESSSFFSESESIELEGEST